MTTIEHPTTTGAPSFNGKPTLRAKPNRRRRWIIIAFGVLAATIIVVLGVGFLRPASAPSYVTAPVSEETLTQSVTATGTVNPQNTIAVGTQVSGTIQTLYVDFNSKVHKGQVLAKLDPTTFGASLAQAQAQYAQAQAQADAAAAGASGALAQIGSAAHTFTAAQATRDANETTIANAHANIVKANAALALAQTTLNRDTSLLSSGYIAQSQFDTDRSGLIAAQTALSSAQAAELQAEATTAASAAQAAAQGDTGTAARDTAAQQAALTRADRAAAEAQRSAVAQAQTNLDHTVITSPVDGTVVSRVVSVGQTVAASLQTPTLFSIAQNLSNMEVDLAVGEPDIGNVRSGEVTTFTVLAYPNRTFTGKVAQVRINPTTVSNVVTYTTVVLVDNRDGALLPGMTANASIAVAQAANGLVVPTAALSYHPATLAAGTTTRRTRATGAASPWGATSGSAGTAVVAGGRGSVFVLRGAQVVRVPVTVKLVSGTQAAVTLRPGTLAAGDLVITADTRPSAAAPATAPKNPLVAQPPAGVRGVR